MESRIDRQFDLQAWAILDFGVKEATNTTQRAIRLLEESIEAYQAAGATAEMAHRLVDYVFSRPIGDLKQEIGGVGITLLLLAQSIRESADQCEVVELDRIISKPQGYFTDRNNQKNAAGFRAEGL